MGYKDIFYQREEQYHSINQQHFKIDITEMIRKKGIPSDDFCKQFFILKYMVNLYYPQYIYEFFHKLEESGFDVSSEIVDAMKLIGRNTINTLNESVKQYVMLSPYINDVAINNGKITIYSDEFGNYSFYSPRKYLQKNKKALKMINQFTTQGYCHHLSWELMTYLEKENLDKRLQEAIMEEDEESKESNFVNAMLLTLHKESKKYKKN